MIKAQRNLRFCISQLFSLNGVTGAMKNDSFFNRIPLPLMVVVWLGLVALGAVLVYTVFFNKPAGSAAQPTPVAQTTKPAKPAATQATQPNNQKPPTPVPPTKVPTLSAMEDTSFN